MTLSPTDALQKQLKLVRDRFISLLDERLDELDILREQIAQDVKHADAFAQIQFITHKIAGTASTLGFPEIGQEASNTENTIIAHIKSGFSNGTQENTLKIIDNFIENTSQASSQIFWEQS